MNTVVNCRLMDLIYTLSLDEVKEGNEKNINLHKRMD